MSSKRGQRRREAATCGKKLRYASQAEAVKTAWHIKTKKPQYVGNHAYLCGDHWHLGHRPAKVRQAMAARGRAARRTA